MTRVEAVGAVVRSGRPSRVARRMFVVAVLSATVAPLPVRAQDDVVPGPVASTVDGRVMRPRLKTLGPVGGVWVTIHRVASDSAGPLDSLRTGNDGRFRFRYARRGTGAVYFVSASYDGVAYFSRPLTSAHVTGDDAEVIVFDTTSIHFPLAIKGRHIVISSPTVNGTREIVEAYEIENESDQTLISPDDAHPTWTAPLPANATRIQAGESDVSPAAISADKGRIRVTAPFAPGLKQLSFSYTLPQKSFPLMIPLEQGATVLELLLEEPKAEARGAKLKPQAPATVEQRIFQRYLAADAPQGSSIEVRVPVIVAAANVRVYWEIAGALAALMAAGLGAWYARARRRRPVFATTPAARAPTQIETLGRAIARLDTDFERIGSNDAGARAAYEERRRVLKHELAASLDSGGRSI
ncbi:MAG: hypothetical protein ABI446_03460 [Gemmatimonadaceae bacterium]